MLSIEIDVEFKELNDIAKFLISEKQDKELTTEQFLQLVIDIRNSERDNPIPNLDNKNVVIPERNILQ